MSQMHCVGFALVFFLSAERIRRNFRHNSISVDTLMQYLSWMTKYVKFKMKETLPQLFAVVSDGWSGGDTHYVAVYATFLASVLSRYESVFLALLQMGNEVLHAAEDHYSFLKFVLSVYDGAIDNVVVLVWDNRNTSCAFGGRVGPMFVGCHSPISTWWSKTSSVSTRQSLKK